jgi:glucose-6-phosphate-specific signal transduction histidine kinase
VYLAAFSGVVEEGRLVRIWGVARNITALANLNERLQCERERLKAYARRLAGAEERALRNTAVNLHDGTLKLLTGMKTTLEAVASQAPAACADCSTRGTTLPSMPRLIQRK